ncbi:MAG: methylated-DNA--[protein]-cysteine S-methyltransferase [Gammaproteobacteria bacterium]
MSQWHLKLRMPFGVFGLCCDDFAVLQTEYLPMRAPPLPPQNPLAAEAARQVRAYWKKPRGFIFDLPLLSAPTAHQRRTRAAMMEVPGGEVRTYGDIAKRIRSSPRAVGGACRVNFLPLLVPCHRIVAADGQGGFMGARNGVHIKNALLQHEAR